ncbi:hypothetical protein HYW30_00670 [Candidatus Azambacteria bacterium]|nr:hypothetical protein [Candidatus Azambacteria bacterium]
MNIETLIKTLAVYEPEGDLSPRVWKRIRERETFALYRRMLVSSAILFTASLALTAYRLGHILADRSLGALAQELTSRYGNVTTLLAPASWVRLYTLVDQFIPSIEMGLFLLQLAALVWVGWRLLGARQFQPRRSF